MKTKKNYLDDFGKEKLMNAILEKFVSQKELAKSLEMTEGNLSNRLKNPTPKFIRELEKVGVVINKNKNIVNNGKEDSFIANNMFQLMKEISDLKERVTKLEIRTD